MLDSSNTYLMVSNLFVDSVLTSYFLLPTQLSRLKYLYMVIIVLSI